MRRRGSEDLPAHLRYGRRGRLRPVGGRKVSLEDEARQMLRILQEAGYGIVLRTYAAREVIKAEEDRALYVLTSGMAFLLRNSPPGREAALGLLEEGDIFGNLAFDRAPLPGHVVRAITPCHVAKIPRSVLEAAVRGNPLIGLKLMNLREAQLCRYEEFVSRIFHRKTVVKLAQVLLHLFERFPKESPDAVGTVDIAARLTQEDLALMIASTRESVCAALGELRRKGIVDVHGGILGVLEPEKLREVSRGRSESALRVACV